LETNLALHIHKIQLKLKVPEECYSELDIATARRNRGKEHIEIIVASPRILSANSRSACFVVMIWLRLDSNLALDDFLAMDYYPYNRKITKACGLTNLPDRRTFDRRLANISVDMPPLLTSAL
jgi:hypothetical protein